MNKVQKDCLKKLNITVKELQQGNPNLDKYNECVQRKIGKKEYKYLTLNGYRDLTDFSKSIKDVDFEDYLYQKENQTMVRENYDSLYLPEIWFRAIDKKFDFGKEELIYGSLISAREYGLNYVFNKLEKDIDKKYPFIYKRETLEKTEGGFFSMSLTVKAGGKEKERKELRDLLFTKRTEIEDEVLKVLEPLSGYTFKKYPKGKEGTEFFIIGGFKAAENIFYKSFFDDFYEREESVDLLKKELKKVYKRFKKELIPKEELV